MAKKTVASLQSGESKVTKIIRCVKKKKSGAYQFKTEIVPTDKVDELLKNKDE